MLLRCFYNVLGLLTFALSLCLLEACSVDKVASMAVWQLLPGCIPCVWHDKPCYNAAEATLGEPAMLQRCQDEVSQRLCIRPFCRARQICAKHSLDAHVRLDLPACGANQPPSTTVEPEALR